MLGGAFALVALLLPRLGYHVRPAIEDLEQLRRPTLQRVSETKKHSKRRRCHASFQLADEWSTRSRALREPGLSHSAGGSKLSQMRAEDLAFLAGTKRQATRSR